MDAEWLWNADWYSLFREKQRREEILRVIILEVIFRHRVCNTAIISVLVVGAAALHGQDLHVAFKLLTGDYSGGD